MTWRNGRELNTATVGGKTYSYEYDVNGLRTRKTNSDGGYTQYYIVDGLTVAEQRFTSTGAEMYTLRYLYDESNSPVGFGIQYPGGTTWTNYYFAKNLQGDVIALYLWNGTSTGTLVATYKYDPWGKPIGIYNASGATISQTAANVAAYNPFRYRGYRYDADTGFYYLQSRYYDPAICRFINADAYNDTGNGILGYNMFAYCLNNPVMYADDGGTWPSLSQVSCSSCSRCRYGCRCSCLCSNSGGGCSGVDYGCGYSSKYYCGCRSSSCRCWRSGCSRWRGVHSGGCCKES